MRISIAIALPERQILHELDVPEACMVRQALLLAAQQGMDLSWTTLDLHTVPLGIYGLRVSDEQVLSEGDRLELYRALRQDPKELRRQRAARQADTGSEK